MTQVSRDSGAMSGRDPQGAVMLVTVSPEMAEAMVDSIDSSRFKKIWFQQGADFSKAAEKARQKGIETVTDRCILMYAPPVRGIHLFHRFVMKLFGKL